MFRKKLASRLSALPRPVPIATTERLEEVAEGLMHALQETVNDSVKCSKPRPDQKRWWSRNLSKLTKKLNRLRAKSYRYRALTSHFSHREFRKLSNEYGEAVIKAKQQHWTDYLEDMSAGDIWTANRYLRELVGDGGVPCIPTICVQRPDGTEQKISDNKKKVELFAKTFFPPPASCVNSSNELQLPNPTTRPPRDNRGANSAPNPKAFPF